MHPKNPRRFLLVFLAAGIRTDPKHSLLKESSVKL